MANYKSKRQTLRDKYRVERRVKEHHRKVRRDQKRRRAAGTHHRTKEELAAQIPNDWPFKNELLSSIEKQRGEEKEIEARNSKLRKQKKLEKKLAKERGEVDEDAGSVQRGKDKDRELAELMSGGRAKSEAALRNKYTLHLLQQPLQQKRIWAEIHKSVRESDIILEVLDARDPIGSRCFEVEKYVTSINQEASENNGTFKPLILILNKADLIPVDVLERWVDFFKKNDPLFPCLAFTCSSACNDLALVPEAADAKASDKVSKSNAPTLPTKNVCLSSVKLMELLQNFRPQSAANQTLRVCTIGYANVGKSSVLNTLARRALCSVGPNPFFTKQKQLLRLTQGIFGIDLPAVPAAVPGEHLAEISLKLSENSDRVYTYGPHITLPISNSPIVLRHDIERIFSHIDPETIASCLKIPPFESFDELLDNLAQKAGRVMKGGQNNTYYTCRKFVNDWNKGTILFYSETPVFDENDMDEDDEDDSDDESAASTQKSDEDPISILFSAANKLLISRFKKLRAKLSAQLLSARTGSSIITNLTHAEVQGEGQEVGLGNLESLSFAENPKDFLAIDGSLFEEPEGVDDEDMEDEDDEEGEDMDDEDLEDLEDDDDGEDLMDDDEELDFGDDDEDNEDEELIDEDMEDDDEEEEEELPSPPKKNNKSKAQTIPVTAPTKGLKRPAPKDSFAAPPSKKSRR